jgi:hypothetical protein
MSSPAQKSQEATRLPYPVISNICDHPGTNVALLTVAGSGFL